MMRAWMTLPLALTACGPRAVELPADQVERAAICGIVATADARRASANVEAKLTLEQQGRILHPALLAGSASGSFDQTRTAAVVNAMPGLGDKVTSGKWEPLIPACQAAFPPTRASGAVALPSEPLTAQAGCHDLAEFLTTALRTSEADYQERMRAYDGLQRSLDARLGATIRAQGLTQAEGKAARDKAVAELVQLGNPVTVLDACVERFAD